LPFLATAQTEAPAPESSAATEAGIQFNRVTHAGVPFDVFHIDLTQAELQLFWKDPEGKPFENFRTLEAWLKAQGKRMVFATNSGIYARDRTPLGLHLERPGEALEALNRKSGGGNFFLKPNGLFYVDECGAHVAETEAYAAAAPAPRLALQSGPLLLEEGRIHPKFQVDSDSRYLRSGIGVDSTGKVVIALSRWPLNLHSFALLFRDALDCRSALYLDGGISAIYAPFAGKTGPGMKYVGILAVTADTGVEDGED